ncbi:MAG: TolC family protein [Marinilabiliaceae bacterium]|nr:TolC family protein [Marinilabiliaceae bacterium]
MKKIMMIGAAMFFLSGSIIAQDNNTTGGTTAITLSQAVEHAVQYSKTLQNSKTDLEIYQEKIKEMRANFLPQASGSVKGQTYFGKEMNFGGMPIKMENSLTIGATVSETFAMQAIKGYQIQKLAAGLMEVQYQNDLLSVKKNVIDTYYAILVYERNKEIIEQNLGEMKEIRRQTGNLFTQGYVEKMDTMQLAINVMNLENAILSLDRSIDVTKRLLVLQMGMDITTQLECQDKIGDYISESSLASMRQSVAVGTKLNLENNLDYKLLEKNIQISEETIKLQKYGWIPTVTAAYQYSNAVKGGFMNFDHVGLITVNVPIFDGGTKGSKIRQAKMDALKARTNMALMQDNLMQNDEQYRYELKTSLDAYELQSTNLSVAKEVLKQYKIKYEAGKLSSLDLTQANMNYLSAETSYAEACVNLVMAQTKLLKLYNAL